MIEIKNDEFQLLKNYLFQCCGIDVPDEKSYLFKTRLNELMLEENYLSFGELYTRLKTDSGGELQKRLIEFMTTNETSFFRDGHPFETFSNAIMPALLQRKKEESQYFQPRIRIWSAGCSTGQEPYSIAISLLEWAESDDLLSANSISILATDISSGVLEKAREGVYGSHEIKRGLHEDLCAKYFNKKDENWAIRENVKNLVEFRELNLAAPFPENLGTFDIIFCRNVIIYFSSALKKQIIDRFHELLGDEGILIMGASETLYLLTDYFETLYAGPSIYYRVVKKETGR